MEKEHLMALGRIEGKLDMMLENQKKQDVRLDAIDARVRDVEVAAAVGGAKYGALTGGMATVGVLIAKEILERIF